jgi:hypothetical protein
VRDASPSVPSPTAESEAWVRAIITLHPYFGFTMRPGVTPAEALPVDQVRAMCVQISAGGTTTYDAPPWLQLRANGMGMWSERPFPYTPAGDEIVIGIFGGSVASWLATQGPDALRARLRDIPALRGAPVVVLNFAIHGGKQPQQLGVLNYVLSHGQHLDVALNVDGINELLWAHYNRDVHGIDFSFPSAHLLGPLKHLMAGGEAGAAGLLALADSLRWRMRAERLTTLQRRVPTSALKSACAHVERHLRTRAARLLARAAEAGADPATDPLPFPPAWPGADESAIGAYWQHCSRQFHRICLAHRIAYLHVLQPTPYTSEREATAGERAFLEPDGPSARLLVQQYPRLVQLGALLEREGVPFAVADPAFANIPHTVFSDHWGHLTLLGNEILATLVAERIGEIIREPAHTALA